ncbi:MAG: TonB-dependent receptor, partial [Lysobacterales bacterium]
AVSYSDIDSGLKDSFDIPEFGISGTNSIDLDAKSWNAEVQYLYRTERFRFIAGIGGFDADRKDRIQDDFQQQYPPFSEQTDETFNSSVSQVNAYIYSLFEQSEKLTWTFGLSGDFYDAESFDRNQVNPKFGLTWELNPATVLRLAAFRTLKRPLIANQTIEPTQVAGFNQFYDGVEGEEAWRYGVAIDHRISSRFFGGFELSKRDLTVPTEIYIPDPVPFLDVQRFDGEEKFGRAYLHWTIGPTFIIGLDYLYEKFKNEGDVGPAEIVELKTHRVPLSLRYFHPSGFTGRLAVTYVDQSGVFGGFLPTAGSDNFAVVDASISFRLPKRFGLISLDARNILDKSFMFQDTDPAYPRIQPGRLVLLKFSLSF